MIGVEILEVLFDIVMFVVLLLGGGLFSGVVFVVKVIWLLIEVIGVLMVCGVVMYVSFVVGCLVDVDE